MFTVVICNSNVYILNNQWWTTNWALTPTDQTHSDTWCCKLGWLYIATDTKFSSFAYWTDDMMTSSNGNIFRVTGPLCGEFTAHRWIPITKASDAEIWMLSLICTWINGWVSYGEAGDLRRRRAHYDVIFTISHHKETVVNKILG